jgi:predicted transcriptional regulator
MSSHEAGSIAANINVMRVVDVIGHRTEIFALRPTDAVAVAAQKLMRWHVRTAPVADDFGNVVGILGQSDISSRVVAAGLDPKTAIVSTVMTAQPVCVDIETDLLTCVHLMRKHGISHVVVTRTNAEGEQHFGTISANDLLDVVAKQAGAKSWMEELAEGSR